MLLENINPSNRERLYHKDIGFPSNLRMPPNFNPIVRLSYSGHAQAEANDKYGQLSLPKVIDTRKGDIVEIGVTGLTVTKIVIRMHYDDVKDIVIVFLPDSGRVKTVWANLKSDKHKTLDRSKYSDPRPMANRRF